MINSNTLFSKAKADINIERSSFDRSSNLKTTFNAGKLIPIYVDEVLPGDTFEMSTNMLVRMSTPIFPVMDDCYLDYYFFFVPNRIIWNSWKEFMGENDETAWVDETPETVPQVTITSYENNYGRLTDYFGLPISQKATTVPGYSVNVLPYRAYQQIWNDWYRDQNLQDPIYINKGNSGDVASEIDKLLPVNKEHDYFTSCLPAPQKGDSVTLPGISPVMFAETSLISSTAGAIIKSTTTGNVASANLGVNGVGYMEAYNGIPSGTDKGKAYISNAYTEPNFTINELRQAFAIQRLLERDARGGTRYTEILRAHFGTISPDSTLQRPEYLGGDRVYINMSQVIQTSSTDATSPQANAAGFSKTVAGSHTFTKSFTEHGILMGVACVRTKHTYQNCINRMWSRKGRYDYYWPEFAHIGEQAVLNKEIFFNFKENNRNDEVFGYQEAYADYRYKPNMVTGAFRHDYANGSLDSWHYADVYTSTPILSDDWIQETDKNINRTLAVESTIQDQFLADIYFNCICYRPMPLHSIPGWSDHF